MRIAKRDRPPADLSSFRLITAEIPVDRPWLRFVRAEHADAIGHGHGLKTRFADATLDQKGLPRFEPIYFGSTFRACFVETVLRDRLNGAPLDWPLARSALSDWTCARLELLRPLTVVDLTSTGPVAMRMPSDAARAKNQRLGRLWSTAFHDHADRIDGVLYASRLVGDSCLCVYADRALDAVRVVSRETLLNWPDELATALDDFRVSLARS